MRTIAFRRHHIERLRSKRKHYWGGRVSKEQLQLLINTPKPCSCIMCGNPRKYFKLRTRQELKSDIELEEYYTTLYMH